MVKLEKTAQDLKTSALTLAVPARQPAQNDTSWAHWAQGQIAYGRQWASSKMVSSRENLNAHVMRPAFGVLSASVNKALLLPDYVDTLRQPKTLPKAIMALPPAVREPVMIMAATLLGMSLALGCAWAAGLTVAPVLVELNAAGRHLAGPFDALPIGGRLLSTIFGDSGQLAYICNGLLFLPTLSLLRSSAQPRPPIAAWAAAHAALGLALSPLFATHVAALSVTAVGAWAGAALLSASLSKALLSDQGVGRSTIMMGLASSLAFGPMAAGIALGLPAAAIFAQALNVVVIGLVLTVATTAWPVLRGLFGDQTSALPEGVPPGDDEPDLDLENNVAPRVFARQQTYPEGQLEHVIAWCTQKQQHDQPLNINTVLLTGRSGSGKFGIVRGLAKQLGRTRYTVTPSDLRGHGTIADRFNTLMAEALVRARREPIVLHLRFAEELFPPRQGQVDVSLRDLVSNALMTIEPPPRSVENLLLVATAGTHTSVIDAAIKNRFFVQMTTEPTNETRLAILRSKLRRALQTTFERYVDETSALDKVEPTLKIIAAKASKLNADGWELDRLVRYAMSIVQERRRAEQPSSKAGPSRLTTPLNASGLNANQQAVTPLDAALLHDALEESFTLVFGDRQLSAARAPDTDLLSA